MMASMRISRVSAVAGRAASAAVGPAAATGSAAPMGEAVWPSVVAATISGSVTMK